MKLAPAFAGSMLAVVASAIACVSEREPSTFPAPDGGECTPGQTETCGPCYGFDADPDASPEVIVCDESGSWGPGCCEGPPPQDLPDSDFFLDSSEAELDAGADGDAHSVDAPEEATDADRTDG